MSALELGERAQERDPKTMRQEDKVGTAGLQVPLMTNYFSLEHNPDWHQYQYHVTFTPDIQSIKLRKALLYQHEELLGRTRICDGSILYMQHRLPDDVTEVVSQMRHDNSIVQLKIKLTCELQPNDPQCIKVNDIILRTVLGKMGMKLIGRNYYNPELSIPIPQHRLVILPGFVTSIVQYESKVLLNLDLSHKILRSDTVLDIMYDLHHRFTEFEHFKTECLRTLLGTIVLTRYNNKTYRVSDIEWHKNPMDTFRLHDGSEITYKDYYMRQYEITITEESQYLLVIRPSAKDRRRGQTDNIFLVPELCVLTGLSDDARSDFRVMKDVAHNQTVTSFLGSWNLRPSESVMTLQGRVLPKEEIRQPEGNVLKYDQERADWSQDMRGKSMITSVDMIDWLVVFTQRTRNQTQEFVQTLSRVGPPMGMRINNPIPIELHDDRNNSYLQGIKDNLNGRIQMVLIITPTNKKDRYDAIKKLCCVDHPVPSQVVVARTLNKKQMMMSVATKVAIQMNCKMGGRVWALHIPMSGLMVVGLDTYHDSAKKGQSVGGFIASMNQDLTRYFSRCTFQERHQEMVDKLTPCFGAALKKYHEVNGRLPERIIVYRDGVGDGQLEAVKEHEIPQMMEAFTLAAGTNYKPGVAFIVVKKRINSRFFAKHGQNLVNPAPGTVIDNTVTKPDWFDFFLVSQSVRQGTVTPTHYNGTIRVPAPCQYAHKLAFLVGQSIHRDPAVELSDKLFFL
ncbi:PIWL1-like protein [Mya arenaria]|uniref:PIWL1-like protein n=1 Tax=Mya arenaria TaxID=6604 RepID=A0ABY7E0G2_MYAAR|nr:PIWL1-like protein [Mya arenaria]